jgi:hypothetical protein
VTLSREDIEKWSERPPSFFPEWTKNVLEGALADAPQLRKCSFETYVQGSYANETNIRANSDVDLVVQMQLPFEEELQNLDGAGRNRFWEKYDHASYRWPRFRADVLARLGERFFIRVGSKCVNIKHFDSPLRIPADIVPAIEYRKYHGFSSSGAEKYTEGIFFRNKKTGRSIVSYPKQHLRNGRQKDIRTNRQFKPIVRVFKNARSRCHEIERSKAPSYFIECLVYNICDDVFQGPLHEAYPACVEWLYKHRDDMCEFRCQNNVSLLFSDRRQPWQIDYTRTKLIDALRRQLDRKANQNP